MWCYIVTSTLTRYVPEDGVSLKELTRLSLPRGHTNSKSCQVDHFPPRSTRVMSDSDAFGCETTCNPQATASLPLLPGFFRHSLVTNELAKVRSRMEKGTSADDWQTFCDSRRPACSTHCKHVYMISSCPLCLH